MKLINNGRNPLSHEDFRLARGAVADVPEHIAKIWLEFPGVKKYIEPAEAEKAAKEAKARETELLKENEALKAKLAELEAKEAEAEIAAKEAKEADEKPVLDLEALKKEAEALGIKYPQNIGAEKLAEKIAEAKAAKDTANN